MRHSHSVDGLPVPALRPVRAHGRGGPVGNAARLEPSRRLARHPNAPLSRVMVPDNTRDRLLALAHQRRRRMELSSVVSLRVPAHSWNDSVRPRQRIVDRGDVVGLFELRLGIAGPVAQSASEGRLPVPALGSVDAGCERRAVRLATGVEKAGAVVAAVLGRFPERAVDVNTQPLIGLGLVMDDARPPVGGDHPNPSRAELAVSHESPQFTVIFIPYQMEGARQRSTSQACGGWPAGWCERRPSEGGGAG